MSAKISTEDLMNPRYKVVNDYPDNDISIGTVLTLINGQWCSDIFEFNASVKYFEKYPHLFRKLEWWQDRKIEDMPEYVKFDDERLSVLSLGGEREPDVHKIKVHWRTSIDPHWRYGDKDRFISEWHNTCYSYGGFLPSTETEYLNQQT